MVVRYRSGWFYAEDAVVKLVAFWRFRHHDHPDEEASVCVPCADGVPKGVWVQRDPRMVLGLTAHMDDGARLQLGKGPVPWMEIARMLGAQVDELKRTVDDLKKVIDGLMATRRTPVEPAAEQPEEKKEEPKSRFSWLEVD